jgi:hypothetical protein
MIGSSNTAKSLAVIICLSFLISLIPINIFPNATALYDPDNGTISGGVYNAKKYTPISGASVSGTAGYAYGAYFSFSVKPGYYSLTARASGYYSSTKSVYVYKGQRASVTFYLTPMPGTDTGSISGGVYDAKTYAPITTATVSCSGLYISAYGGYFSKSNVDPGFYMLTASANGYQSSTKSVYVYENQKTSVSFYLTPTGGGGTGGTTQTPTITITQPQNGATVQNTLTISGTMTGVTSTSVIHVYLNNVYQGDIQGTQQWSIGPVDIRAWPAGQYSVSMQADNGLKSQMVSVTFNIGSAQTLQPQQPDQGGGSTGGGSNGGQQSQTKGQISGFVCLSGTRKGIMGANVSIGSKTTITDSVGSYTFADLNDGKYTISASKPGYSTAWANVTIVNGGTEPKDLYLEPIGGDDTTEIEEVNLSKGSVMGIVYERIPIDELNNTFINSSLANATVLIDDNKYSVITDEIGAYFITDVKVGRHNITAVKEGYILHKIVQIEQIGNETEINEVEVKEFQTTIVHIYLKSLENSRPFAFLAVEPLNASIGETIIFNAGNSYDPDKRPLKYLFDFGDGNTTTWTSNPIQSHQYEKEGIYYVSLVVCNDLGLNNSNTIKIPIFVGNQTNTLTPMLTVYPTTAKVGQEISFDGYDSKSLGDAPIVGYLFDFGDEENTGWISSPQTSHSYVSDGKYTAKLMIKDANGAISSESSEVLVTILKSNNPPAAYFTVRRLNAAPGEKIFPVGETIFFDASSSSDPDKDSMTYCFIYGNGEISGWKDTPYASYVYTRSRTYPVGLIVKDDKDAQSYFNRKLTITVTNIDAKMGLMDKKTQVGDIVLANPGDTILYKLNITNLGEYEDTIDITPILNETGNSAIEIIDSDTMLPLTDTNKNKIVDVGTMESQEHKEVFVKVTVPKDVLAGTTSTTTLKLSGVSTSGANQTKNITIRIVTYPDFSITEKDSVKLSSNEVNVGDKLKAFVNITNVGSVVVDNSTNITVIVYDGGVVKDNEIVGGKEIGRKTVPVRAAGEKIVIDCALDQPGKHSISIKVLASPEVNETSLSNNIVTNKEVAVRGTVTESTAIGTSDLLWLAAIAALCAVIAVNQYFLFWKQRENKEKTQQCKQGGLTVYKKKS